MTAAVTLRVVQLWQHALLQQKFAGYNSTPGMGGTTGGKSGVSFILQDVLALLGRLSFPLSMFAYPFYLMNRSPGKVGSHFDPKCNLFSEAEGKMVRPTYTSPLCSYYASAGMCPLHVVEAPLCLSCL